MKLTHNLLLLPEHQLSVAELLTSTGKSLAEAEQTIETTGFSKLCYADGRPLSNFIFEGLDKVTSQYEAFLEDVDAVVLVSQCFDQRIPSISSRIQGRYKLSPQTFCVDIMDGCCGYIKALKLSSMLNKFGYKKILVIAGDLNSSMTKDTDIGTKILFGDGISVTILEYDSNDIQTKLFNDGDLKGTLSCSMKDNVMNMNGFEVFRFTRNEVPKLMREFLQETNQELATYDLVALHQASKLVVDSILRKLSYSNRRATDFSCQEIGNIGAGSIGAWLSQLSSVNLKTDLRMLSVGFGSGLSWGLASLKVNLEMNEVIYV